MQEPRIIIVTTLHISTQTRQNSHKTDMGLSCSALAYVCCWNSV